MGKTKELLMRELSKDKETRQQKFAVFQNRIFKKEGYVEALETLLSETKKRASEADTGDFDRAKLWVNAFEIEQKILAQRAILAQHIRYVNELKKVEHEQNM